MTIKESFYSSIPGLISGLIGGYIIFLATTSDMDARELNNRIDKKADITLVDEKIDSAKREIESKRESDAREFKTHLLYIREWIDEQRQLKRR